MDSCGCILKHIFDIGSMIKKEYDTIKEIKLLNFDQLPIYEESINILCVSVSKILGLWKKDIPIEHKLKIGLLQNLGNKLSAFHKILLKFRVWYNDVVSSEPIKSYSRCFICIKQLTKEKPSKIKKQLEKTFEEINPIIAIVINLEKSIFGSAIRIRHPILQMAWINIGENQLSDTAVSKTFLIESLISMFVKENNTICESDVKNISNLVDRMDSISGTSTDSLISIFELDRIEVTEYNCNSVKDLIENFRFKYCLTPICSPKESDVISQIDKIIGASDSNKIILNPIISKIKSNVANTKSNITNTKSNIPNTTITMSNLSTPKSNLSIKSNLSTPKSNLTPTSILVQRKTND
jgi:hypothetical protein